MVVESGGAACQDAAMPQQLTAGWNMLWVAVAAQSAGRRGRMTNMSKFCPATALGDAAPAVLFLLAARSLTGGAGDTTVTLAALNWNSMGSLSSDRPWGSLQPALSQPACQSCLLRSLVDVFLQSTADALWG